MKRLVLPTLVIVVAIGSWAVHALAFQDADKTETPAEANARKIAVRFLSILEKKPRFGTALDKVYGFHVERGTLEEFVQSYRDRIKKDETDGTAWMMLALLEFQRGHDSEAVKAFRGAERHRQDDPLTSYYLGRSLVLIGQPDKASEAFERAIERKPLRNDLLEIFQALGRAHQRAQHTEEALKVWDRLEKLFPDDLRVQEQIATILADEGDNEGALQRFDTLAKKSTDRYRQVQFGIKVGELKIRLGKQKDAITGFEKLLNRLKPESWLHRDVRQRVENIYLRADDYDGLAQYYEQWLEKHPEDVDAMSRIGRTLSLQGRLPEAEKWYQKAIKLAPSNKQLRKSLIDEYIQANRYADAVKLYEELDKIDPNNPDNIQQWGQLILNDKSKPAAERQTEAAVVWRKLLNDKPDDQVIVSQVADLFRQAKMTDAAIELYKKAIELSPNEPQYREYLGEYYHVLERSDDAKATWKQVAAGGKRNTKNLVRLAEVFHGFGYREDAVAAMTDACGLDPEFNDRVRYSQMLREVERYEDADKQLNLARDISETQDERQMVLGERIKNLQASDKLEGAITALHNDLKADKDATSDRWLRLALYQQALRRGDDASRSIRKSLELDENSVAAWSTAADIFEKAGSFADAVDANRKLADIDRRYRTDYLQQIAMLEVRLGRIEEALKAGRDVIAAAPGNPEHYRFFADLCFQVGRNDDGLDALRRAVRVNPSDMGALLTLARALSERFRTDEALELFWRAFDKAEALDEQLSIVENMSELYLRTNHFDRLISKIERLGRELNRERDMTLCLATAHKAAGDLGTARITLEQLLTEDTRDTQLLSQLTKLAESESDFETAVRYQRRINEVAPSRDGTVNLAQLLLRTGEIDEAEATWMKLVEAERDPHQVFQAVDNLLSHNKEQTAMKIVDRLLRENPKDWEALFRSGVLLWRTDKKDEAIKRFETILGLSVSVDEKNSILKHREKQKQSKKTMAGTSSYTSQTYQSSYPPAMRRGQASHQIQQVLKLVSERNYGYSGFGSMSPRTIWTPSDFGEARIAAMVAIYAQAKSNEKGDEMYAAYKKRADEATGSDAQPMWDFYYLQSYADGNNTNYKQMYESAKSMSYRSEDPAAMLMYLSSLQLRNYTPGSDYNTARSNRPPLSDEELEHALKCFQTITKQYPQWKSYSGGSRIMMEELKLAKREDEAKKIYVDLLESAQDPRSITTAMMLAASSGDTEATLKLADRLKQKQKSGSRTRTPYGSASTYVGAYTQLSVQLAEKKEYDAIRELLDKHLTASREDRTATPTYRRSMQRQSSGSIHVQIYKADGTQTYKYINYPMPNAFYDQTSISYLHQVYQLHQRDEVSDDLMTFLTKRAKSESAEDRAYTHLALAYINAWEEDKATSIEHIRQAAAAIPQESELRLEVALLEQQQGNTAEALALIDGFEPINHNILRRREILALQLAVLTGNIQRARKAAERLFGLRLDNNTQMQLAAQMHQLGMHEMAEGVMARVRRRSGNQISTQLQLMQQYQSQGNSDIAVQIAHQILRRTKPVQARTGYSSSASSTRQQAMQVLARSGQLEELITRVEKQLERSPKSIHLHEILADYYRAAGKQDKAKELLTKIAKLRPNDPKYLFQLAKQLTASGDHDAACENFINAVKKDPTLIGNDYYSVRNAFRAAKRDQDFQKLFMELDFSKLSNLYYRIDNLCNELMRDKKTREDGLALFRKAWKAFPNRRAYLIGNIYVDEVWELDEMYEYARQGIIPSSKQQAANAWQGIADSLSFSQGGMVTGTLTRITKALKSDIRKKNFTADVEAALKKYPEWHAGNAILVVLEAKAGKKDSAKDRLQKLIDNKKAPFPTNAGFVIGQELSTIDGMEQMAMTVYEFAVQADNSQHEFEWNPARQLAKMYAKVGRREDARQLVYDLLAKQDYSRYGGNNAGYVAYRQLEGLRGAGEQMLELNYPVDAVRFFNQAMSDGPKMDAAKQYYGSSTYYLDRMKKGMEKAKKALTPEAVKVALRDWLRPPRKRQTKATEDDSKVNSGKKSARPPKSTKSQARKSVVDLVVMIQPRTLDKATMTSMFQDAVKITVENSGTEENVIDEALKQVEVLRKDYADDVSVYVADVLLAFAQKNAADKQQAAIERLSKFISAHPLEISKDRKKLTAAQRSAAEQQLPVWLAAREALKHEATRAAGEKLAQRAITAARMNADTIWVLAMLRERGQMAIDAGDRKAAEKHWSEMLEIILGKQDKQTRATRRSKKTVKS